MAKQITNTLTRWHKIAERVLEQERRVMQDINTALTTTHRLDVDAFEVRRSVFENAAKEAATGKLDLLVALQAARFKIKTALGRANVEFGVSALLTDMKRVSEERDVIQAVYDTSVHSISATDFEKLIERKKADETTQRTALAAQRVTFVPAEVQKALKERIDAAVRHLNALADKLADANASKITLDIDEAVATAVGL
jgi:hypothetical protein